MQVDPGVARMSVGCACAVTENLPADGALPIVLVAVVIVGREEDL